MAPGRQRTTRLDPKIRRRQIVDAAAQAFEGRDPHAVTFEEIAGAAGVSRGLVYNYFATRGDLLAAVHLRSLDRLDAAVAAARAADASQQTRVRHLVRAFVEFAVHDPPAFRNLVATESGQHPDVVDERRRRARRIGSRLGDTEESAVMGAAVVGVLEGATAMWLDEFADQLGADDVIEALTRFIEHGLAGVHQRHQPPGPD